ncbi:MAG: ABC transporter permease, partial [Proteobacteria bacterium]
MLVLRAILREWRQHPWQIALNLLGVAIGVAVVVAVDLANVSAEREFMRANRALDGIASHRIMGPNAGVDESLYTRLKVDLGIRDAAPAVRAEVRLGESVFTLLGIDPVSDYRLRRFRLYSNDTTTAPFPLFVSPALAARLALDPGVRVTLSYGRRSGEFHVAGTLGGETAALPDNVLITDIAAAQAFLGMPGRLNHIDLRLGSAGDVAAVRSVLPKGVQLVSTDSRNRARFDMTRAFRINLTALAMLALVIGLFLVYNSVGFQVVRRRPLFGLFRALGVTANGVLGYLAAEAAVVASIG